MDLLPLDRLPVLPAAVLRAHKAFQPTDPRFRAAARVRESIWRASRGLPIGSYTTAGGVTRKLGSRLNAFGAAAGANFVSQAVHRLAVRDYAYREPGAAIDQERLFANLLSSMPMAFNLAGPLKLDGVKADRFVKLIMPSISGRVISIWFEHSPGRGDPNFLNDGSAFDIFVAMRRKDGAKTFLAFEIKYAEGMSDAPATLRPQYDELSETSCLYQDHRDEALRRAPLQQLWREHMLAHSLVASGLYDAGVFVLVAPALNAEVQRAATLYQRHLADGPDRTRFINLSLGSFINDLRHAGAAEEAQALHERYLDFTPVHALA